MYIKTYLLILTKKMETYYLLETSNDMGTNETFVHATHQLVNTED